MRAALQKVQKWVRTTYKRGGVFGSDAEENHDPMLLDGEWDDVVCVMSLDESEQILKALQLAQTHPEAQKFLSAGMILGLERDLRKLKDRQGEPVFRDTGATVSTTVDMGHRERTVEVHVWGRYAAETWTWKAATDPLPQDDAVSVVNGKVHYEGVEVKDLG